MIEVYLAVIIGALFNLYILFFDDDIYKFSFGINLLIFPFGTALSSLVAFVFIIIITSPWRDVLSIVRGEIKGDEIDMIEIVVGGFISLFFLLCFYMAISIGAQNILSIIKVRRKFAKLKSRDNAENGDNNRDKL